MKTTVSQIDRTKSTLSEVKRHKILCTDCGKYLGSILELNKPAKNHTYLCHCICGHECFSIKTSHETSILTEGNYTLMDMKTEEGVTQIKIGKVK